MEQEFLQSDRSTINYRVIHSKRKSLSIKITGDTSFEVRVPLFTSSKQVSNYIERNRAWIMKHVTRLQALPEVPALTGEEGSELLWNLQRYTIIHKEGSKKGVKLIGSNCIIYMQKRYFIESPHAHTHANGLTTRNNQAKKIIEAWYKQRIEQITQTTLNSLITRFEIATGAEHNLLLQALRDAKSTDSPKTILQSAEFRVRTMKRRWGSCYSSKRLIILNRLLAMGTDSMITYVVVHEICHLWYHYHDKNFYHLLDVLFPDWKGEKERLTQIEKSLE